MRYLKAGIIILVLLSVIGCGNSNSRTEIEDINNSQDSEIIISKEDIVENQLNVEIEEVSVIIPELKNEYKFVYVSDLHIIMESEEVAENDLETVRGRIATTKNGEGITSTEMWDVLPEQLDSYDADAILLGGDMVDFASTDNIACLEKGLIKMQTPYIYVRADHDLQPYYCDGLTYDESIELHKKIDENREVFLREYEDLCIVGINDSTSQLSMETLAEMKEIVSIGKPIILLTHVPLNSLIDSSLEQQSKEAWQDRALVWGEGCYYEPNETTKEFLDMVYAENSLFKEVLCGHLHFSWDGGLTENTHQHVFDEAYSGKIGIITVSNGK